MIEKSGSGLENGWSGTWIKYLPEMNSADSQEEGKETHRYINEGHVNIEEGVAIQYRTKFCATDKLH